ncbi:carboxypeptidase-like regulatory domain-containing protein [Mangrovivirga cuniculi]|uniref:Carboxypeptidase-like regulatory domain-containing protein n=1 Tax=Mangrovivirga cuniculi TaxID=2715131 RepID=A0A4D7JLB2_9BACT|nr:carboxypeptidase-like regulatory domain-containing protein [Mangrovivirga cuniculi]QCK15683.1 hypothetical protein DCC35_13480 [Mangrovivirga cuniculi]
MRTNLFFTALFFHLTIFSQQYEHIKGIVLDNETNKGIPSVHVSVNNGELVTITNSDGEFIIKSDNPIKRLLFSHLGYNPRSIDSQEISKSVNIKLEPRSQQLKEVVVVGSTARKIVEQAIDNIKNNHFIEPVNYAFFTRIIHYTKDSSLHFINEHVGHISQNKIHNSKFGLLKSRMNYFSAVGEELLKKYRLISLTEMYTDNLGKYQEDYIHHRRNKAYSYTFKDDINIMGRECYQIAFTTDEKTYYKSGILVIDKKDYGIHKKILTYGDYKEINFNRHAGHYYLSSTHYIKKRSSYIEERYTIYNKGPQKDNLEYVSKMSLTPKFTRKYSKEFDDEFWKEFNFIPLPGWIKTQIETTP